MKLENGVSFDGPSESVVGDLNAGASRKSISGGGDVDVGGGGSVSGGGGKMGQKPGSAPGSVSGGGVGGGGGGDKPKWFTSKGNALKEIESWATDGHEHEAADYARHSGQLMDNVTEQRMLQAKLWDLSKERHKFLTQNAYEKKIFLDRQQRKSAALRDMLDGVSPDGRRISWADEALRRRANVDDDAASSSARGVLLDRVDPRRKRDRPREAKDLESRHSSCPTPPSEPPPPLLSSSGGQQQQRATQLSLPQVARSTSSQDGHVPRKNPRTRGGALTPTVFSTEPKMSRKSSSVVTSGSRQAQATAAANLERPKTSSYDHMLSSELHVADHPPTTVRFADCADGGGHPPGAADDSASSYQFDRIRRPPSQTWSTLKPWGRTPSLSARSRATTTDRGDTERDPDLAAAAGGICTAAGDPRYKQLREALSENYLSCEAPLSIAKIIGKIEALNKPPQRSKDCRPRVTHRIREFMRDRGFQF